ncbi:MAG: hypothetical protein QW035_01415 [Candidatus Anstonellales archaeon]
MQKEAVHQKPAGSAKKPKRFKLLERDSEGLLRVNRPAKNLLIPLIAGSLIYDATVGLAKGAPVFTPLANEVLGGSALISAGLRAERYFSKKPLKSAFKEWMRIVRNLSLAAIFFAPAPLTLLSPMMLAAYAFMGSAFSIFAINIYEKKREEHELKQGMQSERKGLFNIEFRQEGLGITSQALYGDEFVVLIPSQKAECSLAVIRKAPMPKPTILPPSDFAIPLQPSQLERCSLAVWQKPPTLSVKFPQLLPLVQYERAKEIPMLPEPKKQGPIEELPTQKPTPSLEILVEGRATPEAILISEGAPERAGTFSLPLDFIVNPVNSEITLHCRKVSSKPKKGPIDEEALKRMLEEEKVMAQNVIQFSGVVKKVSGTYSEDEGTRLAFNVSTNEGKLEVLLSLKRRGVREWVFTASAKDNDQNSYEVEGMSIAQKELAEKKKAKKELSISPEFLGNKCRIEFLGESALVQVREIEIGSRRRAFKAVGNGNIYSIYKEGKDWWATAIPESPKEEVGLLDVIDARRAGAPMYVKGFELYIDQRIVSGLMEEKPILLKMKGKGEKSRKASTIKISASSISVFVETPSKKTSKTTELLLRNGCFSLASTKKESAEIGLEVEAQLGEINPVVEFIFSNVGKRIRFLDKKLYFLDEAVVNCKEKSIELNFILPEEKKKVSVVLSGTGVSIIDSGEKAIKQFASQEEFFGFLEECKLKLL